MIENMTKENFEQVIHDSDTPVLVDFWAPWCVYCKRLNPIIDDIEKDFNKVLKVVKVDIDKQQDLAKKFKIESIPTLLLFKDKKNVDSLNSIQSKSQVEEWLSKNEVKA